MSAMRLDRLLANLGYGSRREVAWLAGQGRVALDGAKVRDPSQRIDLTADLTDRLRVNGAPIDPPSPLTLIMHKPLGVVCSHREPADGGKRRLDADTSGLLLITDDGQLLHQIISPKRHVPKSYVADLDRPLGGDEGATFAAGTLMLEGETTALAPAVLEPLTSTRARLTITEGRYHQVRRMFAAVGNHVVALRRDRIGGLDLPAELDPGDYRALTMAELTAVLTP